MEFTQPLGVGLGLDPYTTINDTQEISQESSYLLGNVDAGTQEFAGMGNHVNDGQTTWTDKLQMMTSRRGHTSQLHKQIAHMNCTKQDDVTSKNGNDE